MTIELEASKKIFLKLLNVLINNDTQLVVDETSERSICCRLSSYLEKIAHQKFNLINYYADSEYNRKQDGHVKSILPNNEMGPVNVVCDLILHSRGQQFPKDNLIAIEMKKSNRSDNEKIVMRLG